MDHDRLFKELLTTFFAEFVDLFLPEVAAGLDRSSIQFVDKEVFTDVASGDRHEVDLLARVRLRDADAFILVHVENQSSWRADFPRRMFRYFSLIYSKHGLPVYPVAVYSFDRPASTVPAGHDLSLFGFDVVRFSFRAIQLNTLDWRDFVARPNPVASALMAKMRIDPADRPRVKRECMRMMFTLRLDPARSRLIWVFMNTYLRLTAEEMKVYNREMQQIAPDEKEFVLVVENEWTEMGRQEGRLEGLVEGRSRLIQRQLTRRFGEVPPDVIEDLARLDENQTDDFAEALLDFGTLDDARAWLKTAGA